MPIQVHTLEEVKTPPRGEITRNRVCIYEGQDTPAQAATQTQEGIQMFERDVYRARPGIIVRREKTGGIPWWLFLIVGGLALLSAMGN
jgi:hypothetical protein